MNPIHHLDCVEYLGFGKPGELKRIQDPSWVDVEGAIRKMDNYYFPIVELHCDFGDDESVFLIIGGSGRWALLNLSGEWEYENPEGLDDDIELWKSDQGYSSKEKNTLVDIEKVLNIIRMFFKTGNYIALKGMI